MYAAAAGSPARSPWPLDNKPPVGHFPVMAELLSIEELDVQEEFFARAWTDGLPIVAPTPDRVQAMLDVVDATDPDVLIGYVPARSRGVSMEQAAINAV